MIDCHSHLALPDFDEDRGDVIDRAWGAGVEFILVVGQDQSDNNRVLAICRQYPKVLKPCIGMHPDRFGEGNEKPTAEDVEALWLLARRNRSEIVGIGEVGLDYWSAKDSARRSAQRQLLSRLVGLSNELELPMNIHSRSAGHYTLDLLAAHGARRVLMHAFDGKAGYAVKAALEHGWCFSIPPSIARSAQKQKLVRALPLASLALESDSPVLGPERDIRNEPANIAVAVRMIAEIKGTDEETVIKTTTANAKRLFGLS